MAGTRLAHALTCVALALAVAACSGGSKTPSGTSSPDASATPNADAYPEMNPNITPRVPIDRAITHGNLARQAPLKAVTSDDNTFSIKVPENWTRTQAENQKFLAFAYVDGPDPYVNLNVQCTEGATVDQVIESDRGFIFAARLAYQVGLPLDTVIGGHAYREVRWSGGIDDLVTDNITFYIAGACGVWELQFGVYHGLRTKDFRPLFEEIVASFQVP